VRATFDGRYKFARYFSPVQRHQPTTPDQLYQWNDVSCSTCSAIRAR
jgi:arylsulfatase